jgi:hypothetical protein
MTSHLGFVCAWSFPGSAERIVCANEVIGPNIPLLFNIPDFRACDAMIAEVMDVQIWIEVIESSMSIARAIVTL